MDSWKFSAIFLFCFIVTCLCQEQEEYPGMTTPEPETTTEELKCHLALGQWIPKLMEEANMCISDNPNSYDRMRMRNSSVPLPPINCIMRCIGKRLGLVLDDGTIGTSELIAFIEENVIPVYRPLAYDIIANCAEHNPTKENALTDPNCTSHGRAFKCIADAAPKIIRLCALRLGIHPDSYKYRYPNSTERTTN